MVWIALRSVPFLCKSELLGIHVDFSTKVFSFGLKLFKLFLCAHLIFIFLINLSLFSMMLDTGINLGVGIKDKPFSKRVSSASENLIDDKF